MSGGEAEGRVGDRRILLLMLLPHRPNCLQQNSNPRNIPLLGPASIGMLTSWLSVHFPILQ